MGRHSKSESDVEDDVQVGGSPAYRRNDGSHRRRTTSEQDFDADRTGANGRNQEA
jgi:hypothetical protein